jgi:hypothetical protein
MALDLAKTQGNHAFAGVAHGLGISPVGATLACEFPNRQIWPPYG